MLHEIGSCLAERSIWQKESASTEEDVALKETDLACHQDQTEKSLVEEINI